MYESIARILTMLIERSDDGLPIRGKILIWVISITIAGISLCCLLYAIAYLIHSLLVWFGG